MVELTKKTPEIDETKWKELMQKAEFNMNGTVKARKTLNGYILSNSNKILDSKWPNVKKSFA